MFFTDIFIKRPVLATVVSLFILALGLRSVGSLSVRQYPYTENAVVTVSTTYTGADPAVVAGFITTPLENSIAQANGELGAMISGEFAFKSLEHGPLHIIAAQQHFLHVGVNLFLDVAVLPDVAVKFDFHKRKSYPECPGQDKAF